MAVMSFSMRPLFPRKVSRSNKPRLANGPHFRSAPNKTHRFLYRHQFFSFILFNRRSASTNERFAFRGNLQSKFPVALLRRCAKWINPLADSDGICARKYYSEENVTLSLPSARRPEVLHFSARRVEVQSIHRVSRGNVVASSRSLSFGPTSSAFHAMNFSFLSVPFTIFLFTTALFLRSFLLAGVSSFIFSYAAPIFLFSLFTVSLFARSFFLLSPFFARRSLSSSFMFSCRVFF